VIPEIGIQLLKSKVIGKEYPPIGNEMLAELALTVHFSSVT